MKLHEFIQTLQLFSLENPDMEVFFSTERMGSQLTQLYSVNCFTSYKPAPDSVPNICVIHAVQKDKMPSPEDYPGPSVFKQANYKDGHCIRCGKSPEYHIDGVHCPL